MTKRALGIAFGLITLLGACGSDSSGGGGSAGSGNKAPASTGDGKFHCAKEICELPDSLKGEELCCMDAFSGGCGIKAGTSCRAFPKMDERCALPNLVATGSPGTDSIKAFGCCTTNNQCGIDFGMGCQADSFLCQYISKDDAAALNWKTCDGMPLTLPADCGQNGRVMIPGMGAAGSGS
jgi:hypothetical protein